jgi:hypothetical protein
MSCLLALSLSCLFDPANVYVSAGLESQFTNREPVRVVECYETAYCARPAFTGPMGVLRLGVKADLTTNLTLDYGIAHRSYVNTNRDNGFEVVFVELTWRPFR